MRFFQKWSMGAEKTCTLCTHPWFSSVYWSHSCRHPVHVCVALPISCVEACLSADYQHLQFFLWGELWLLEPAQPTWEWQARVPENEHPQPMLPHSSRRIILSTYLPPTPRVLQQDRFPLAHSDSLPNNTPLIGCLFSFYYSPTLLGVSWGSLPNKLLVHLSLSQRLIRRKPKLRNLPDFLFIFIILLFF